MEVPPLVQLLKLAGGGRYRESRDGSPAQPPHSAARWDAAGFGVGCLAEPACGDTRSLAIPAGRTPVPCLSAGRAVLPLGRTAPGAESGARFCPSPPWVFIFYSTSRIWSVMSITSRCLFRPIIALLPPARTRQAGTTPRAAAIARSSANRCPPPSAATSAHNQFHLRL